MVTLQVYLSEDEIVGLSKLCRKQYGCSPAVFIRKTVQKLINDDGKEKVKIA